MAAKVAPRGKEHRFTLSVINMYVDEMRAGITRRRRMAVAALSACTVADAAEVERSVASTLATPNGEPQLAIVCSLTQLNRY